MNKRGLSPGEGTARRLREFGDEITLGRSLLAEAEKAIKDLEAQNHALTIKTQELVSALGSAEAALAQKTHVFGKPSAACGQLRLREQPLIAYEDLRE